MPDKLLIKQFARTFEIITAIVVLLLLVFLLQMIALGIAQVLAVPAPHEQAKDIQKPKELTIQEKIAHSRKEFLPDGTMLFIYSGNTQDNSGKLATEIFDANSNLIWQGVQFKDANNKPVWQGVNDTPPPFKERDYLVWNGYEDWGYRDIKQHLAINLNFSESLNCVLYRDGNDREVWRYSISKGYFTGYTSERKIIGYIGSNGFVKNKTEVKSFGKLIHWDRQLENKEFPTGVLWITDHYVCLVDVQNRKVDVILKTETSKITKYCIRNSPDIRGRTKIATSATKYRPAMDFVTADNIHHLILQEPQQVLNVPLPKKQPGKRTYVMFTATENDIFFKIAKYDRIEPPTRKRFSDYEEYISKEFHTQTDLYKLNQNGTLDIVNHCEWTWPARESKQYFGPVPKSKPYITAFSPPFFYWLYYLEWIFYYTDYSTPLDAVIGPIQELRPLNIPLNLLISIAIMGFTLWHGLARRTSWAKLIFWVILTGLLNLAGLLAYLALNHTPVIKCPACGKNRGLETDNCSRCGGPLPLPQQKPTDLIMAN